MEKNAFSLVEVLLILVIAGLVFLATPAFFHKKHVTEAKEPQVDYDCFVLQNGFHECYIYVDGEFDTTCEYSELSAIIKEKKGGL